MRFITAVATDDPLVPCGEGALVPWWSFTKTAIAAAALALVSQGRLHLDAPIPARPFTLRQLLQHRAGLPDYGGLTDYHQAVAAGADPWPEQELLERVSARTLVTQPGGRFLYSNVGYLLVRGIIEQAAGLPLALALQRLVFDPLALTRTRLATQVADLDATAWGNTRRYHPGWVYHGLLIGPASEAATLLHRLLGGALLPPPLLNAMCAGQPVGGPMPDRPWRSAAYGLGLMRGICDPAACYIGHSGAGPGSTAAIYQIASRPAAPRTSAPRTAAVFAPVDAIGTVERHALALANPP